VDNQNIQSGGESVNIQDVSQSGHTAECEHVDPVGSVTSHEASVLKSSMYPSNQCQKCCDKGRTSKYQQHSSCVRTSPAIDSPNSSAVEDGPSCCSSPKRKLWVQYSDLLYVSFFKLVGGEGTVVKKSCVPVFQVTKFYMVVPNTVYSQI
jgi:hypothetical protein